MQDGPDRLPISLVAHWDFCPRRAWLEAVGEQTDTAQMQAGIGAHVRADDPRSARGEELRAVEIYDDALGITGRLDTAERTEDGLIVREYKATPVKRRAEVTDAMRLQLALQTLCLSSMGEPVAGTEVFFTTHHRRVAVELGAKDFDRARDAVAATRGVISADVAPEPLEDDPRCSRCSHAGVCLPDERRLGPVERRIRVADPDGQIVHLTTPGSRASSRAGQMVVQSAGEVLARIPLEEVQGLQVHGNVDVSSGLMRELLWRGLTIVWCSGAGRVYGWAVSGSGPNGAARVKQHVASAEGRLAFAREFVSAKIANQATQLRRSGADAQVVALLRTAQRRASGAERWQDVIGREGEAAAVYFANWPLLVKERLRPSWPWSGRSGRPASDELNALLNYAYAMLTSDGIRALVSCGLDPHAGFLHSSNRNKPALALDLIEEFRAPVADSVVQTVVNNGEVRLSDFDLTLGTARMKDRARRALVSAYERRMQTEFRHPVFDYPVTWRRALEIQARQVLGVLDGSQREYRGIRLR